MEVIGFLMIAAIFGAIFIHAVATIGLRDSLITIGIIAGLFIWLIIAAVLLAGGT